MLIADLITLFLACFGYVEQYRLFIKEKHTGRFSIYMTAFMVFACVLKAYFWFIEPYGTALFIQNFLLITINLMIIHKYVQLGGNENKPTLSIFSRFWQWRTFKQYITCLLTFVFIVGFITFLSVVNQWRTFGHLFASVATVCEICIAIPQVVAIARAKSADGVSKVMIGVWLCSDAYKTLYFILMNEPIAFIVTGSIQLMIDGILITQMIIYREKPDKTKNS